MLQMLCGAERKAKALQTAVANDGTLGERLAYGRLLWVGPLAGLSAAVANSVVYLAYSVVGAMPRIDVSGLTTLFRMLSGRPVRNFRVLAAMLLALSFVGPLNLTKVPAVMIASLLIMHVVAAVLIVGVLTTLVRKDRRERIANGKPEKRRIGR